MAPAVRIAVGFPLMAVYMLVVLLALDMDTTAGQYAFFVPVAYLLGAVPWGYLLAYTLGGVDITQRGSGRTGTANVLRLAGKKVAAAVLVLDAAKGAISVALGLAVSGTDEAMMAAGLAALVGHNWSMFLGFKGGRGVATGGAGLWVMQPIAGAIGLAAFVAMARLSHYASLGSLVAVLFAFGATLVLAVMGPASYIDLLYAGVGGGLVVAQHRDNIQRLWQGSERRLGQPAEDAVKPAGSAGPVP